MKYQDYLKSEYWKKRRAEFKSKTHNRCYICHSKEKLHVHHKRYKRNGESILFKERHTDFRLLCSECHRKIHKYKLEEILAGNQSKAASVEGLDEGIKVKVKFNNKKDG